MNQGKFRSPTKVTFKNPSFQSSCELGKSLKYSLRPAFKNPNFEYKNEIEKSYFPTNLNFTLENKWNLHKKAH